MDDAIAVAKVDPEAQPRPQLCTAKGDLRNRDLCAPKGTHLATRSICVTSIFMASSIVLSRAPTHS